MKARHSAAPASRRPIRPQARPGSGYENEDLDEIESLPRDAEHDEEERDPDPERYPALSEHAQERRGHPGRPR